MGLNEDIATLKSQMPAFAHDFFIELLRQNPNNIIRHFPNYKNKTGAELKGYGVFTDHVENVVNELFNILASGNVKAGAQAMAKAPQHRGLKPADFDDLFSVFVPYVKTRGCGDFKAATDAFVNAMK